MTAPTEPTPGAPAAPAQPQQPAAAPTAPPPWERDGQPFDPEKAWNLVQSLRGENDKLKTGRQELQTTAEQAKTVAQQAQDRANAILRAAGFNPDGTEAAADPQELADQYLAQAQEAQDAAWGAGANLTLYQVGADLGANVAALRDSVSFMDGLDELLELQPGSTEFTTAMTSKVQAAMDASPDRYRTAGPAAPATQPGTPRPDPSQGARGAPPTGRPTSLFDAISRHLAPRG